jgi:hypothetical protein
MVPIQEDDGVNEEVLIPSILNNVFNQEPSSATIPFQIESSVISGADTQTGIIEIVMEVATKEQISLTGR